MYNYSVFICFCLDFARMYICLFFTFTNDLKLEPLPHVGLIPYFSLTWHLLFTSLSLSFSLFLSLFLSHSLSLSLSLSARMSLRSCHSNFLPPDTSPSPFLSLLPIPPSCTSHSLSLFLSLSFFLLSLSLPLSVLAC